MFACILLLTHFGENDDKRDIPVKMGGGGVIRVFWGYSVKNHRIASSNIPNRISRLTELHWVTLYYITKSIIYFLTLYRKTPFLVPGINPGKGKINFCYIKSFVKSLFLTSPD